MPVAQSESKSYFVADLFRKIVFPDQAYAGRSKAEMRRQSIIRGVLAIIAARFGGRARPARLVHLRAKPRLLDAAADTAAEAAKVPWANKAMPVVDKVRKLDDIRAELKQLDTWKQEGAPVGYRGACTPATTSTSRSNRSTSATC